MNNEPYKNQRLSLNLNKYKIMKKTKLLLSLIILTSIECYSQQNGSGGVQTTVIQTGIGLGSVLAVVFSWERNKSILWAILHGIFSWLYVLYFAFTRKPEEKK